MAAAAAAYLDADGYCDDNRDFDRHADAYRHVGGFAVAHADRDAKLYPHAYATNRYAGVANRHAAAAYRNADADVYQDAGGCIYPDADGDVYQDAQGDVYQDADGDADRDANSDADRDADGGADRNIYVCAGRNADGDGDVYIDARWCCRTCDCRVFAERVIWRSSILTLWGII
jgi:hypothetical protein